MKNDSESLQEKIKYINVTPFYQWIERFDLKKRTIERDTHEVLW